jgi:two-component system, NtrC family, response regulator AtoC
MRRILVADDSSRDAQRFRAQIEAAGFTAELCASGAEAAALMEDEAGDRAALVILWEIPGPPFGPELLARSRRLLPGVPVVVVSSALDATLATRAFALGARDFLQKPLDIERVKSCLDSLLSERDPYLPLVDGLKQTILGESPAMLSTLTQVAKIIGHGASRVLLIGESGTGKELLAQAFHNLGAKPDAPFVAVNVAALPKELTESMLFGHEKGAFTGANESHRGYMEEAADGTLFLDELGELDLSLQSKLLRALQENKFRRLKGAHEIEFKARLVCATNRDLPLAVSHGAFRRDLYHRVAEVTIEVPPLRERKDDIALLLDHFLTVHGRGRKVRFARETLTILHSYPFRGNVRELENAVKTALMECDGEWILPQHLPLPAMGAFLKEETQPTVPADAAPAVRPEGDHEADSGARPELFQELARAMPEDWCELPYNDALARYVHAFDRIYLPRLLERYRYNKTKATRAAGIDKKKLKKHWEDAGLPPLSAEEGETNE